MSRAPPRRRYCATHQEMREAVARGLDGPGISPLDVLPQTWAHCPGFEEEMEHRRRKVEAIKVHPPAPWPSVTCSLQAGPNHHACGIS